MEESRGGVGMRSFKDNEGRDWLVAVNVATVKRVRAECGVDLASATEPNAENGESPLERLAGDPVLLVDVLYSLCRKQAEKRGVDDEAFGTAIAGDSVAAAADALMEAIVDFFPNPRRKLLMKALTEARETQRKAEEALEITATATSSGSATS